MSAKNKSNELQLTRVYDAPVKAVWDAWTDEKQVGQWWGPRGFTITTHSKDLRPGGQWIYTMHGPDGVDYPNMTTYYEVEPCARLVYDHGANDKQPALFRVTALFSENAGKTTLSMTMAFASAEAAIEAQKFIKKAGGESTWDRLAEYLTHKSTGKEKFVINRSFKAPIKKMFQLWTVPNHLEKWVPPTGFEMKYIRVNIKEGGSCFYEMSNGAGLTMYGRADYREIRPHDRIVYTQQFCDANEKVSRHPMAPTWPETMLTIITLTEEGPDQTRVTIQWEPYGQFTSEELATFVSARAGMTQGWTGSLDKLELYLS